ncbi:MAG: ABC transporter ATP-binding protein/permease [Holosporales bacterium]|nr:ABC transporter ATP-binding protein/permease [Holosporales bacterium]
MIKRLLSEHIKNYHKHLLIALFCMGITAASTAAFPYFLKPAFDYIFETNDKTNLIFFCVCIFVSFMIKGISSYFESLIMQRVGQKIVFDIQERLFSHLMFLDLKFFNNHHSGDLLSRFSNDTTLMRNAVSTTIIGIGRDILTFISLAGVMFYRDAILAAFAFIIFPALIAPIILLGRKMKNVVQKTQEQLGAFSGNLAQTFQGIRIVKAYGAEMKEIFRIKQQIAKLLKLMTRSIRIRSILHPISECVAGIAIIFVLTYGGLQVIGDKKTAGDLISFLGALIFAYEPLRRLTQLSANMQEGIAAAKRIFNILDTKPTIKNPTNPIFLDKPIESIEFRNVCFSYCENQKILDNVSFKITRGQTIAFVGKSGAGKSTIINLIPRFYDIDSGEILLNETNIKQIDIKNLRSQIAIVTQENILFDSSFYNNILYGRESATSEEVIAASKLALSDDFISKTKNGYETIVGENGVRISGGQRQRISIARAMLKNSPIILLDEATSSLDTNSEKAVQKTLDKLMKNRTTIIVAHRLSSIVSADIIYVLDSGCIQEFGSHETLISQKGIYYNLWLAQINENTYKN